MPRDLPPITAAPAVRGRRGPGGSAAPGWRRWVARLTFGLVVPGRSAAERDLAEASTRIATAPTQGHIKIGVFGKGGAGKTTMAAGLGSLFAQLRPQDRVVAVDADTSFGRLGSRVDPAARSSFWEVAEAESADSFADVRRHLGANRAGLYVLPGEQGIARRRVLEPGVYREAMHRLDRHFTLSVVDCGSTTDSAVAQEVLRDLDALVVVTSPWIDAATSALQTMDWLYTHGHAALLTRTVVVVNDSDGHAERRAVDGLAAELGRRGVPVVTVPFEPHFRPGGVVDIPHGTTTGTRGALTRVAALLAGSFAAAPPHRPGRLR